MNPVAAALPTVEERALRALVARVAARYAIAAGDFPDLLQETRIALWEAGTDAFTSPALAARIATNKAVDVVRRLARIRGRERAAAVTEQPRKDDAELRHLLNARVDELPRRLRDFYEMHYEQGFSEREIARGLGLCRASVRWLDRCCRRYLSGPQVGKSRPRN